MHFAIVPSTESCSGPAAGPVGLHVRTAELRIYSIVPLRLCLFYADAGFIHPVLRHLRDE